MRGPMTLRADHFESFTHLFHSGTCSVLAALGQHDNCLHEQHDGAEMLAGLPSKGA